MNLRSMSAGKPSLKEMLFLALLSALMVGTQVAMAFLPNVHLVAMLVILTTLLFGWKALYAVFVFVLLEGMIYGFAIWTLSYLYAWPLLVVATMLLGKSRSPWLWAAVAGIHGLTFGAQCAIPYFVAGGWTAGFSYWVAGLPFDLIHCVSNAVVTVLLLQPLYRLCSRLLHGSWAAEAYAPAADAPSLAQRK